jgi:hypothetical protein
MSYPSEPPRGGMPPWAKWTLIGCGGCLTVAILFIGVSSFAVWQFFGKNIKIEKVDVRGKPDLPLTAAAGQLLPPRVGSFVRTQVVRLPTSSGNARAASGWHGTYASGSKRVELIVMPTAAAQSAQRQSSPFGDAMRRQKQNPGGGIHMSMRFGSKPLDMVVWSKPNWTVTIQSPDMAAKPFALAYHPAPGSAK